MTEELNNTIEQAFDESNYHKGDDLLVCFNAAMDCEQYEGNDGTIYNIPFGLCFNSNDDNLINKVADEMINYDYPDNLVKHFKDDVINKDLDLIDSIQYYVEKVSNDNFLIFDNDLFNAYTEKIENLTN